MDSSNSAVFVNADLLRLYAGNRVRAVIKVIKHDGAGSVIGLSTDGKELVVTGYNNSDPLTTFVEVIGIAEPGPHPCIQAEIWNNFGDNFDTASYDSLCKFANGDYKHLFI